MSFSTQTQPKSILKKTQPPLPQTTASVPVPQSDAERSRLAFVLEQARLIQEQKEVLFQNLNYIEELSDYPQSSAPTEEEKTKFLTLVMQFQPSDYDSLVEERQVNNRCGYTLCPNPPRKADIKRPWLRAKGSENWCSDDCAKRALYIKAQLDEVPAWERRGGATPPIVLYDEDKLAADKAKTVSEQDQRRNEQRELALERGEGKVAAFKIDGVMSTEILEKTPSAPAKPPVARPIESEVHNLIEGYQTRDLPIITKDGVSFEEDEDEDEEDTDLLPFCPPRYNHLG